MQKNKSIKDLNEAKEKKKKYKMKQNDMMKEKRITILLCLRVNQNV